MHRKKQNPVNKFILDDKCDSLLFSALAAVGMQEKIDILAARNEEGQWFRTPAKDCLATGRSGSTISRDMFMGLFWYMFTFNEQDMINELWEYGEAHEWLMGEGSDIIATLGRAQWAPSTIALLAEIRFHVNGIDNSARNVPDICQ